MKAIKVDFNCDECENKGYCQEGIIFQTKDLSARLAGDSVLDKILGQKILKGVRVIKYCAFQIGDAALSGAMARVPKISWLLCEHCRKKDICGARSIVDNWQTNYREEVENDLNNSSISTPWIDSKIVCELSPKC